MDWKLFSKKKRDNTEKWNPKTMFGANMSFAVAEAYKLLRTNIMFSFSDEDRCRVIGVTSSIQAEGKSSTAANTAYALAEAGAKVLLMDADLRRPSIASKMGIARTPGLSNLLIAKGDYREALQKSTLAPKLDILSAGDTPPNPSELLGSGRMARLMEQLKENYEYIVVDLPPIMVVSDAVAISKLLDGVVIVVRGGVSDQQMLAEAVRQLEMVNVRILGFVYRDIGGNSKKYGKNYNHKYYKYKYYNDYQKKSANK